LNSQPFISCDWGTSSFRLRWVDPGLCIRREVRSDRGCKSLFGQAANPAQRGILFEETLLKALEGCQTGGRASIPLVISGMASSSIGWHELPYLREALRADGSNLLWKEIQWNAPTWLGPVLLISGVATDADMIRGEETEAIGILQGIELRSGALVLPGTHSKHLLFADGKLAKITTFMTGELFEVLSNHSVLSATVQRARAVADTGFDEGVLASQKGSLSQVLFKVRARGVLDGHPPRANASFLSGALIGAELCTATGSKEELLIGGDEELLELYARAALIMALPFRKIPKELTEQAAVRGQAMLLKRIIPTA
jgi:2-dehydro-3-deoxygalactonokinase